MKRGEFTAMFGTKAIHQQARERLKKSTVAEIVALSEAALARVPADMIQKQDRTKRRLQWAFTQLLFISDPATSGRN